MEKRRIIEAALFMSSRPLSVEDLSRLLGISALGYVEKEVKQLKKEYDNNGSSIQIVSEMGQYIMRLRPEYSNTVRDFAQEGEISKHALKVLAYIHKREGILKSKLVKGLGTNVYASVKELIENEFVEQKPAGRSSTLHTTKKFKQYFEV